MLGFAIGGNHTGVPTTAATATSFSDATSFVMFVNTSSENQTLYHGSSADTSEQIGSILLNALKKKNRFYGKRRQVP